MVGLFEEKNGKNDIFEESNAILFFNNDETINVNVKGKHGTFYGYITFIEGEFTISDLQNNGNEMQFFATDCVNIEIDKQQNRKNIIVIGKSFVNFDQKYNSGNITLVNGLSPENISNFINNDNDFLKLNHQKCALFFPENINDEHKEEIKKIKEKLKSMQDYFYNVDLTKKYSNFLPYYGENEQLNRFKNFKKFPIFNKRKNVAVIDFGISESLKTILQSYFNVIYVPYTETAKHIKYLYYDNKIDGVIFSNFNYNTSFINQKINNELKEILDSNIPKLCIGAGAVLTAELLGSTTKINNNILQIENFDFENIKHRHYKKSNLYYKTIDILSKQLKSKYYNKSVNIVGFESIEKNITGYCFDFINNNIEVAFFLNEFYKKMKNEKR